MKRCVRIVVMFAVTLAACTTVRPADAQSGMFARAGFGPKPTHPSVRLAQALPGKALPSAGKGETLPSPPGAPDPFQDDTFYATDHGGGVIYEGDGGYFPGSDAEYGYPCGECCDEGCYGPPQPSWWDCWDLCGICGTSAHDPRWYFVADYLYVRANFSEAVAFVIQDDDTVPGLFTDTFHELDFRHESSYRVGGGYQLGCCGEELRFMFTRLSSFADAFTDNPDAIGPYETSPGPGGTLNVHAFVNSKSWDLDYAKTIPLGGGDGCGCGDPCGCGDACCPPPCPAWDITWSGGLRFADVDWTRRFVGNNPQAEETRVATSTMDFEGGGPRFGLTGRRYFGQNQWCSAYLKGDISLLLGHVQLVERRDTIDEGSTIPGATLQQSANFRNIIPVTEIEAGLSAQLSRGSRLSAGYLFSAWHDLGFRDQFEWDPVLFLQTNYDDANILGWDGFFARLEFAY